MKDYYTVSEYAKVMNKDPGNIRRLLLNGELKGEKLGKQWIIPKDCPYPEDKRVTKGDYRNWRTRFIISRNDPDLMRNLMEMSRRLSKIYGEYLVKIALYGSYARNEQTDESDIDIALIIGDGNTKEMHDEMIDVVVDYEIEIGRTLSVVPIDYAEYKKWNKVSPFYQNIDKEGIVLWKAV